MFIQFLYQPYILLVDLLVCLLARRDTEQIVRYIITYIRSGSCLAKCSAG